MEASAIPANVGLARTRAAIGTPLLRLRSDEQLVSMFRSGNEDAFRAIHDRYRTRLFAYSRQMLASSPADAEDAVQEIFVRAYGGLRASDRELALRAWLYRIAHNRCIDELRRPQVVATEEIPDSAAGHEPDPVAQIEQRDALRRLIDDVRRLPDQQRSALLMRELGGMTYADVAGALGVSVPAVKSLLVRARVSLAQANEARDTACAQIREDLMVAHDRGVRTSGLARRHMRDCPGCREFRSEVRGVSRQLAAFVPGLGPLGVVAKLLGLGGAGAGGSGAAASGGAGAVAGGGATVATGAAASAGAVAGAGHVVTLLAAAVVTAGGAIELQHMDHAAPVARAARHHVIARSTPGPTSSPAVALTTASTGGVPVTGPTAAGSAGSGDTTSGTAAATARGAGASATSATGTSLQPARRQAGSAVRLTEQLDPDDLYLAMGAGNPSQAGSTTSTGTGMSTGAAGAGTTGTTGTTSTSGATGTAGTSGTTGTASTGSTGTPTSTGTGTSSATTTAGASTDGSATPSTTTSTGGAAAATTVAPAASKGTISGKSGKSRAKGKGSGTVAVFTMTGS